MVLIWISFEMFVLLFIIFIFFLRFWLTFLFALNCPLPLLFFLLFFLLFLIILLFSLLFSFIWPCLFRPLSTSIILLDLASSERWLRRGTAHRGRIHFLDQDVKLVVIVHKLTLSAHIVKVLFLNHLVCFTLVKAVRSLRFLLRRGSFLWILISSFGFRWCRNGTYIHDLHFLGGVFRN